MSNVIRLDAFRKDDFVENYRYRLRNMSKNELLEEMVSFQEESSQLKTPTIRLASCGYYLYRMLKVVADTEELRILSRSYYKHLEYQIDILKRRSSNGNDDLE